MSRIGIDVDGVLRDFCGDLETIIKKEFPQYIPEGVTDFKINDWKISNCVSCSKEDVQQIYWYTHCDKIMANGNPMYGAIKKMYDLFDWGKKNGHTFVCITSQKPHARYHTLSWLGKYGLNFDTVYFRKGRDKWKVNVDYLVDDSPNNHKAWVYGRGMEDGFILMDAVYNQHINSSYRIKSLDEVQNIII